MMNWNLKANKIFVILFLVSVNNCLAQGKWKEKTSLYGSLGAVFSGAVNTSESNELRSKTQTYKQYQDSISSKETWRFNFNPQIGILYEFNRSLNAQIGLSYIVLGHQRQLSGLNKYGDSTYPGIGTGIGNGIIIENTNAERNIKLNYRYQYLQLPILLNYQLSLKSLSKKFNVSLSAGGALNLLLKHDIRAVLSSGYTIEDKSTFNIDSTGYKANALTYNLMAGFKVDYNYLPNVKLYFQPLFGFFPSSVSSNVLESKPWYISANFGVTYAIDKVKK